MSKGDGQCVRKAEREGNSPLRRKRGSSLFVQAPQRHFNAWSHDLLPSYLQSCSTFCRLSRRKGIHCATTTSSPALPTPPPHPQSSCNMSAQAAAKAASQAAKSVAQNDRGFLNRGAKRDPELYVRAFSALSSRSFGDWLLLSSPIRALQC